MRHYSAKTLEFPKEGFTDLFILSASNLPAAAGGAPVNDFLTPMTAAVKLTDLAVSDIVYEAVVDVKTPIAGPTGAPTGSVLLATATTVVTTAVTLASGIGNMSSTSQGRVLVSAADSLVFQLAAGGGNGATATAGEVWIWAKIGRAGRLSIQA